MQGLFNGANTFFSHFCRFYLFFYNEKIQYVEKIVQSNLFPFDNTRWIQYKKA